MKDNLQRSIYLVKYSNRFWTEISPEKSEMMAFLGQDPARYYIIVDNICEEF
jgi:hypothetical protein